jgi:hypothetical protein
MVKLGINISPATNTIPNISQCQYSSSNSIACPQQFVLNGLS